jgi:hypothetical protein
VRHNTRTPAAVSRNMMHTAHGKHACARVLALTIMGATGCPAAAAAARSRTNATNGAMPLPMLTITTGVCGLGVSIDDGRTATHSREPALMSLRR